MVWSSNTETVKTSIYFFVACVGLSLAVGCKAEPISNSVPPLFLTNNVAAARWPFNWKPPFTIPTNTPAFEAYGLELMLAQANDMREKWRLDIPQPLSINEVFFAVFPTAYGIEGHLMTRDRRFDWSFDRNVLFSFQDRTYCPATFRHQDNESARLAKIKSKITAAEAEAVARDALSNLFGLTEKQMHLQESVEVHQYKFEESDGVVYPLPMFNVVWSCEGPTRFAAENMEYRPVHMDISGITKNVADYSHAEYLSLKSPIPRPPLPTNYFQMLGLPDKYLETVSARQRSLWGLPPLTNSPSQVANPDK